MQATSDQVKSMEEYLREKVLHVLRQIAPEADLEKLDPQKTCRDQFEFDSVDFLNFAIGLQEELKVTIPEVDFPKLGTITSCIDYLKAKIGSQVSSGVIS